MSFKVLWKLTSAILYLVGSNQFLSESPFFCQEVKPVSPKGSQPWIFIGRIDAEAEAPVLWPPDGKSRLTEKDTGAGKDWRQKEKRAAEDEMVR